MKLKLSGMRGKTMDKKYHMYDVTSPKFQDKEINIPDNKIIDDNVLPPPTIRFLVTFKQKDKQLIITEQKLSDNEDYIGVKMDKEKVLHGLNSCTTIAGVPDICGFTECPYRHDGPMCQHNLLRDIAEMQMLYSEPEKVEGIRHAYGHTDMIGDCPTCGLTVYKRINACYCGACGQRIKWE